MNKVEPALTSEEWVKAQAYTAGAQPWAIWEMVFDKDPSVRHAHAALALDGQPFGFTHEDVALLHAAVKDNAGPIEHIIAMSQVTALDASDIQRLSRLKARSKQVKNLADRIEALLPPEEA